jgi:hypothetical protein
MAEALGIKGTEVVAHPDQILRFRMLQPAFVSVKLKGGRQVLQCPSSRRLTHRRAEVLSHHGHNEIHESMRLAGGPSWLALIQAGGDLKPYLSRHIVKKKRPDWNDGLLNSWGIQHLHFRHKGTDHLLFCVITDTDVYLIQVLPHVEEQWVNTQLIQILHDNWPGTIARANHSLMKPEAFSTSKRQSLRGYNANFAVTVADGTVYLPLAGGTTASGDSIEDHYSCRKIFDELKFWQETIASNVLAIRLSLNLSDAKKLTVHMAFENRICCFYEPTRAIRLGGFAGILNNS